MSTRSIRTVTTSALALATAAGLLAAAPPAGAAPSVTTPSAATTAAAPTALTDPATVIDPDCRFEQDLAQAWTSRAGVEHVIYEVEGNESFTCVSGTQWHAWRAPGEQWTAEETPYLGRIMAVTGSKKTVYFMYADEAGVHLAKRKKNGAYREVELLTELGLGTHVIPSGSVAVQGRKWWAVWTENRDPSAFGTLDLWQAKTIGTPLDRTRITDTPSEHEDQPRLALRSDGSAFLLWTQTPESGLPSFVRYGESVDGAWSNKLWDNGLAGLAGDVAVSGDDVVSVGWTRNSAVMYADDSSGAFVTTQVLPAGAAPALAVSGGEVFLATTVPGFVGHLLSRGADGGAWADQTLSTGTVSSVRDVTSRKGDATVYYSDESKLVARSTQ